MHNANAANTYKNQQVLTTSPENLTLMLYDGAIRFVGESISAIEEGKIAKSNNANLKAQNIVKEFMCTLDMQYDLSENLMALYEYINYRLVQGNLKKDHAQLIEAKNMLIELRETWQQVMKISKVGRAQQGIAQGI